MARKQKLAEKPRRTLTQIIRAEFGGQSIQSVRKNGHNLISNDTLFRKVYEIIVCALEERPAVLGYEFYEAYRDLMPTGEVQGVRLSAWSAAYTAFNKYIRQAIECGQIKSIKLGKALKPKQKSYQPPGRKEAEGYNIYWQGNPNRQISAIGNVYYTNEGAMRDYISSRLLPKGKIFNLTLP